MPNTASFQLPQEFLIAGAAVQTGIFEALKKAPCRLEDLAAQTGCDRRALWTVVEALIALGYLTYDGEQIKLTEEADNIFFRPGHAQYAGFSFMHAYNLIKSWMRLPEVLQSGQPVPKDAPRNLKDFIGAMSHHARHSAPQIAAYCLQDLPAGVRVLDVGGGPLTNALAFAAQGATVTVLDLPEVIEMMEPELELEPDLPVRMVKGDFTAGLPPGLYDLVYLGNVCHIYGAQENRQLFQDAAAALAPGGRIVICDMIRGTGVMPAIFAVNMLINTPTGGTWTFGQYEAWLADAGFTAATWEEVAGRQLIKAVKAG